MTQKEISDAIFNRAKIEQERYFKTVIEHSLAVAIGNGDKKTFTKFKTESDKFEREQKALLNGQ